MATYRGQDGSVTVDAGTVLEVKSWTLTVARDLLEDTAMGDTSKTYKAGLNDWSGTIECHLDYGDTTGQKILIDNILASSGSTIALELLIGTGKKFVGTAVPTSMNTGSELTSISGVSFNFQAAGALSISWV